MERQAASPTEAATRLRRPRVLVVDDDPGVRLVCAVNLKLDGFDVIEAGDGQEGLERALADPPDVVLLDVTMPVLDGFGLVDALRQDGRTRALPLVFLTGERDAAVEAHAMEVGAAGFFSKPFEPQAISALLAGLLPHCAVPDGDGLAGSGALEPG